MFLYYNSNLNQIALQGTATCVTMGDVSAYGHFSSTEIIDVLKYMKAKQRKCVR